MKMKFNIAAVIFFFCILIFTYASKDENNSITIEKIHEVKPTVSDITQIQSREHTPASNNICANEPTTSLLKVSEIISIHDSNQQIRQLKESFKLHPLALQKKITSMAEFKSRELHSIALFYLAKDCFQMSISSLPNSEEALKQFKLNQCDSLPEHLLQKPFIILEDIVSENSLLGKVHYLTNAIKLSKFYNNPDKREQNIYSREILARAEKLGFEAARAGIKEANYAMSRAYREGLFGTTDPVKAYEYLLPLSKYENKGDLMKVINETKQQIKGNEINKIEKLEKECLRSNNVIANPFN